MDRVIHAVRSAIELLLAPLDVLPPWLSLTVIAVLTALLMLVAVKRVSPQRMIGRARDRMAAAIYEMRLFLDEPRAVLRAQGRLLGWMGVYMVGLLPASAVLAVPLGLVYLHLETRHGLAPIEAPATIVLRVGLASGIDGHAVEVECTEPLAVTAPILFAPDERAAYVRLHVAAPGTHHIAVRAGGHRVTKEIVADRDAVRVAPERTSGLAQLWSYGHEAPLDGAIRSVSLRHRDRAQSWFGLAIPWWLYWLGAAMVFALALRRRFGVVF